MTTDLIGQQLGNYTIIQLLGQGGFADVYLGEHIYLKSQAAVKVLQAHLSSPDDMNSFLKEAQTIAQLFHPHIIRILDFGVAAETPFLVMDYAPKGTLRQKHPRGTPVPLTTVVLYVKQVADALQYAHDEVRLIHRDIKPENMLIGRRDEILLSDFGIALVAQSSHYQNTQNVIGTVAYMAPEQIQGKPHKASDQYSLAVVVYEWLTGDRPFQGSFTEMCTQHIFAPPPPLSEKAPSLPPHVNLVVMQALAKDPRQRFESIQAFANALEQVSLSQGGERTEQMSSTFHSMLTSNTGDISYPPTLIPPPTNTPSIPLQNAMPDQPFTSPAQTGQFISPQASTNQQNTAQTGAHENFTPSFSQSTPSWVRPANRPIQPAQSPQQQVVLPSQPAYTPNYPGADRQRPFSHFTPQAPSNRSGEAQFPPRQDNSQQRGPFSPSYPTRSPQQQAMAPQRSTSEHRYNNTPDHTGFENPSIHADEGQDEGLGMGILSPLLRPFIATIAGIILFCGTNFFHPLVLGRPMLFTLAVPLIFGAAFGPIIGLLVGIGGVFCLNLIMPPYIPSLYIDYNILHEHMISLQVRHYWWHPLLVNGLVGFMSGLSMLGKRRLPTINSVIQSTILGAIALLGSFSFILYSDLGLRTLLRSIVDIAILGGLNVIAAFALLVIYSIIGELLNPSA